MRKTIFILIHFLLSYCAYGQDLTFTNVSPVHVKEEKEDRTFSFTFKLEDAKIDCDVTVGINDKISSATKEQRLFINYY